MLRNITFNGITIEELYSQQWISIYIYTSQDFNKVLLEVIDPLNQELLESELIEKFFFIRYFEKGNHLRLRYKLVAKEKEVAIYYILNALSDAFYSESQNDDILVLSKYLPEIERYGGINGLTICEDYFEKSSKLIISLLRDSKSEWNETDLMFNAAYTNYIYVMSFTSIVNIRYLLELNYNNWLAKSDKKIVFRDLQTFLHNYDITKYNKAYLDWEKDCLKISKAFFQEGIIETESDIRMNKKIYTMLDSLMHMNNNRIGVTNSKESEIALYVMTIIKEGLLNKTK